MFSIIPLLNLCDLLYMPCSLYAYLLSNHGDQLDCSMHTYFKIMVISFPEEVFQVMVINCTVVPFSQRSFSFKVLIVPNCMMYISAFNCFVRVPRVYTEMHSTQNGQVLLSLSFLVHLSTLPGMECVVHILHVLDEVLACLWSSIILFLHCLPRMHQDTHPLPWHGVAHGFLFFPPLLCFSQVPYLPLGFIFHLHWFLTSSMFWSNFLINLKVEIQWGIKYWYKQPMSM